MHIEQLLEKKPGSNAAQVTLKLIRALQVPVTAGTVIEIWSGISTTPAC